jgi:hypothetical protein
MTKRTLALLAFTITPALASAQTLMDVTIAPAQVKVGEPVKITVNFDVQGGINCGLRLHFSDGKPVDYKINQQSDVPLVVTRKYAKPGGYSVTAEPRNVERVLKCGGETRTARVKVAAADARTGEARVEEAPKPAPAPKKAAGPRCPGGWTLDPNSVNRKTGAFTCRAEPGTRIERKLTCPGDLSYVENEKKGLMACR